MPHNTKTREKVLLEIAATMVNLIKYHNCPIITNSIYYLGNIHSYRGKTINKQMGRIGYWCDEYVICYLKTTHA